ncbi:MAG: nucleotidyltransferase domain-containing protein, partial [Vibrio sp.]
MNTPSISPISHDIQALRQQLDQFAEKQKQDFLAHQDVNELVLARSGFIDDMLSQLWQDFGFNQIEGLSLIAVGGYGRAELHPLSDIDILILSKVELNEAHKQAISCLITLMWDLHLEVGHS